jgi:hypothetical protein
MPLRVPEESLRESGIIELVRRLRHYLLEELLLRPIERGGTRTLVLRALVARCETTRRGEI